ncbi:hypothetical protein [Flavobacterium psychrophilum]|uniref:hypothetical protein n=1 Tax=Flavobacterium psychrophilum TaxID=96345 RepID=UPI0007CBB2B6|nr:hypothetical protein [Flavobacterium psychrophilum]ELM3645111.1 hypothetical protein [Flavobacterium psychrophilum]OAE90427.1 hypothetical protein SU65_11850 [Flavobacterium psychrophilum]
MRTSIIYILTMVSLISCNSKIYEPKDVKEIDVTILRKDNGTSKVNFNNFDDIKQIIDEVNKSKREPIKFIADYKLILKFKDSTKTLLIKNGMMNIEGITYRLNHNLGNIINDKITNR